MEVTANDCSVLKIAILGIFFGLSLGQDVEFDDGEHSVRARRGTLKDAKDFLEAYDDEAQLIYSQSAFASWAYSTNLTEENAAKRVHLLCIDRFSFKNVTYIAL